MPQFNSTTERTNAPPRRKSCEACKTAKRRCDLAFPACFRCARRNIPCAYPGQQPQFCQETFNETYPATFTIMGQPDDLLESMYAETQCTTDFNFMALPDIEPPIFDLPECGLDYRSFVAHDMPDYNFHQNLVRHQGSGTVMLRTRSSTPISTIIAQRLQFAIDKMKDAPRTMVVENQTPWCHSHLYKDGMPRAMQDAYSCCALYMATNEINAPVILSSFKTRIQDLLSSTPPSTPLEALAHTQALILYLIMCLFDGDIQARTFAEPLLSTLSTSALTLLNYIHFPTPTSPSPPPPTLDPIMNTWPTWIYQESARRTVLVSFYFTQIYRILQDDRNLQCDGRLGLVHSWYLSAHLWSAQSAFDFAVAWTEKSHFVVCDANFAGVLQHAQPGDVDLLGKMMLSTLLGIDEVKAWFYSRGAIL